MRINSDKTNELLEVVIVIALAIEFTIVVAIDAKGKPGGAFGASTVDLGI